MTGVEREHVEVRTLSDWGRERACRGKDTE